MIDRSTIERILATADIVDVVSEFVTLKKAGMNYKGLCPFHDDKTPSFSVSPSRNYCHCFSCGKGGTPVGFIMEHLQMTYPEALRWLAKKYNIEIHEKEKTDSEREEDSEREALYVVNEWAAKYYHDILLDDVDGRAIGMQYFRSRGFRDDIIEKFRLGFALPDRHAMPREAMKKGYKAEYLLKSGLCYTHEEGKAESLTDRFYGRAIFPWIGLNGKVVAFGGRKLDKATKGIQQKYVNSPESVIYHKANELYGIFQAKKAISRENSVYMVEGYTDVLAMHQCGIENVVANSGTALSQQQIRMLHRFTKNIVLLYDGDAAGQKAIERGTDMLLENGMNIKILLFPEGEDPDSFARKSTPEEFRTYLETHQTDFIQYRIDTMVSDVADPVRRGEMISAVVKSISLITDPITRAAYIQDCASRLHMPEQTLTTRMNAFIAEARRENEKRKRIEEGRAGSAEGKGYTPTGGQSPMENGALPPEFLPPEAFSVPGSADNGTLHAPDNPWGGQRQESQQGIGREPVYATGEYSNRPQREGAGYGAATAVGATVAGPHRYLNRQTIRGISRTASRQECIERDIITAVVRNGEKTVKNDVETENGEKVSLTLAEYVFLNLQCDDIHLHNAVYNAILEEAVGKSHEEGFEAMQYFSRHPDIEIMQTVSEMICDHYVLSKSLEQRVTEESLLQYIDHLLLALRRDMVDTRLAQLLREIAQKSDDSVAVTPLMEEYRNLREISNTISKRLGKNLR